MIDPSLGRALIRILLAYDDENHDDYIETGEGISEGLKFATFLTPGLGILENRYRSPQRTPWHRGVGAV